MILGQINIRVLREDILAAELGCSVVAAENQITLSGADAETGAESIESQGFSRKNTNEDGSLEFAVVIIE